LTGLARRASAPAADARATPFRLELLLFWGVGIFISVIVLVPLVMLLLGSLSPSFEQLGQALTLEHYARVYTHQPYYESLANTLFLATSVTVLATILGGLLAWLVGRANVPGARWLELLIIIPLFVSPFLGALGWALAVRPGAGLIGTIVQEISYGSRINLFSPWGMIWVLVLYEAPYAFIFISSSLRSMDPALEQAASMVGLGIGRTARLITLPLVAPAVLSAMLLIFVSVCGQFGVPVLFGLPANYFVVTTRIFALTSLYPSDWAQAATLSTLLLAVMFLGVYLQIRALGKGLRRFATITGRGYRPGRIDLGRLRWGAGALAWFYVLVGVMLPIGTLIYASFLPQFSGLYSLDRLTLSNYVRAILEEPRVRQALANSIVYSSVAATLGVLLTAVAAWVIYRSQLRGRRLLEYICMVPSGIPSSVLAVAFLWSFIRTPVYGTMWIMVLAYIAAYIPYGIRAILPGMNQIDPSLEEAGRISGLSWFRVFSKIVIPLVWPSLVSSWLLLFLIFVKELPLSIMLYSEGTQVLSVPIYDFWTVGRFNDTAALASVQILLIAAVAILVGRLARTRDFTRSL
jgi:iron(III) transport system permease protein